MADSSNKQEPVSPEILSGSPLTLETLNIRLASQLAPWRWRRVLTGLAHAMDEGASLESAIGSWPTQMPAELRHLLESCLSAPNPTQIVIDALSIREEVRRSWRELVAMMAYPLALLCFALLVGLSFSFTLKRNYFAWMEEWGFGNYDAVFNLIDDQYHAAQGLLIMAAWFIAVIILLRFAGPSWALTAVAGGLIVVGRPIRWNSMRELLLRMHLFVKQGVQPTEAAELVAHSFQASKQSIVSSNLAKRLSIGMPLGLALSRSMHSDGLCVPGLLRLDTMGQDLPCALKETADLLGQLADQRCRALSGFLPVFVLAMVGTVIGSLVTCYIGLFMPFISLMTSLA